MKNLNKTFEAHEKIVGTWKIKIKVKEVGIKFQKEDGKFLEIDIHLLNVFKKYFAHRNIRCDRHECNKHVSTLR
jgi:hypothetical protein